MLNVTQFYHCLKHNENQLGVKVGTFILFTRIPVVSSSVANITFVTYAQSFLFCADLVACTQREVVRKSVTF
jgi:hypothetical protein